MSRLQSVIREIDTARCVGQWHLIPDLSRRYAKASEWGEVYKTILTAEQLLEEKLLEVQWDVKQQWLKDGRWNAQGELKWPPELPPLLAEGLSATERIHKKLEVIEDKDMSGEERVQYKTVLARIYFHSGQYSECQRALQDTPNKYTKSELSESYGIQLYLMRMVMRGILHEIQGRWQDANDVYEMALAQYHQELAPSAVMLVVPKSMHKHSADDEDVVNWADELLYRRCFCAVKLGLGREVYQRFYYYINNLNNVTPAKFRIHRRIAALRTLIEYISMTYRRGEYVPHGGPQETPNAAFVPNNAKQELVILHCEYVTLLRIGYDFPAAGTSNTPVLEEVDRAAADWRLVGATNPNDTVILLQLLYISVQLTFNSPRVFRHLINTLVQLGDWHEARLALNTYIGLVERQIEKRRHRQQVAGSIIETRDGNPPAPSSPPHPNDAAEDEEPIEQIVGVLVTGSKLLLKAFDNTKESLRVHRLTEKLQHEYPECIPLTLAAQIYLWKGVTHGLIAAKADDRKSRLEHHQKAIDNLNAADELDPNNCEIITQLALQHASGGRDIDSAFGLAKRAVNIDSNSLWAWQALILLITARKDYAGAFKACELALKRNKVWSAAEKEIQKQQQQQQQSLKGNLNGVGNGGGGSSSSSRRDSSFGNIGDINVVTDAMAVSSISDLDKSGAQDGQSIFPKSSLSVSSSGRNQVAQVEEGMEYLRIKMLQSLITREIEGPESALRSHAVIFHLYGRVVQEVQLLPTDDASHAIMQANSGMFMLNPGTRVVRRNSFTGLSLGNRVDENGEDAIRASTPSYRSVGRSLAHSLVHSIKSGMGIKGLASRRHRRETMGSETDIGEKKSLGQKFRQSIFMLGHPHSNHSHHHHHHYHTLLHIHSRGSHRSVGKHNDEESGMGAPGETSDGVSKSTATTTATPQFVTNIPSVATAESEANTSPGMLQGVEHTFSSQGLRTVSSDLDQYLRQAQTQRPEHGGVYYTQTMTRTRRLRSQMSDILADMWLFSAICFMHLKQFEDAHQAIEEAGAVLPHSPKVFTMRGLVYLAQGRVDQATSEFNSALSIRPDDKQALVGLARAKLGNGRQDVALGLLVGLTSGKGWNMPEAWYWLGLIEKRLAAELSETDIYQPPHVITNTTPGADSDGSSSSSSSGSNSGDKADTTFMSPQVMPEQANPNDEGNVQQNGAAATSRLLGVVASGLPRIPTRRVGTNQSFASATSATSTTCADGGGKESSMQQLRSTMALSRAKEFLAYALDMEQTQPLVDFESLLLSTNTSNVVITV